MPITVLQSGYAETGPSTSGSVTVASTTSGSTMLVAVSNQNTTLTWTNAMSSAVTDFSDFNGFSETLIYARKANISAGTTAITFTLSGSNTAVVFFWEVAGLDSSPVDATAGNTGSITTTQSGDLVLATAWSSGGTRTWTVDTGAGWTGINLATTFNPGAYIVAGAAASYTANFVPDTGVTNRKSLIAYKAAPASASVKELLTLGVG